MLLFTFSGGRQRHEHNKGVVGYVSNPGGSQPFLICDASELSLRRQMCEDIFVICYPSLSTDCDFRPVKARGLE